MFFKKELQSFSVTYSPYASNQKLTTKIAALSEREAKGIIRKASPSAKIYNIVNTGRV